MKDPYEGYSDDATAWLKELESMKGISIPVEDVMGSYDRNGNYIPCRPVHHCCCCRCCCQPRFIYNYEYYNPHYWEGPHC